MSTDKDQNNDISKKIFSLVLIGQRLFNLLSIVQADIEEFKSILREIVIETGDSKKGD